MQFIKIAKNILAKLCKKTVKASAFVSSYANRTAKYLLSAVKLICKNVIRPAFNSSVLFLKRSPRVLAAFVTVVLLISCTVTVALATGATTAYAVMYKGNSIAAVKEPAVLAEAEILAAEKLNNPVCNAYLIEATLSQTIVSEAELLNSTQLADIIIGHSEDIVTAAVLEVEGEVVASGEAVEPINTALEEYLNNYKSEKGLQEVDFCGQIAAQNIYTVKSDVAQLPTVEGYLEENAENIAVQTITTVVETREIAFKTVKSESNALTVGTQKVTQQGVNGMEEVTYKVATVNGVQTEKTEISSVVTLEPVDKKVTVGTKRIIAADKNGSAPMLWPVKRVERAYVSSYVGDGRGHKGMDIVSPAGTPIYAAEGGTVTCSGWDTSGYGYKIVIKHSNGLETLYAHCSALYVKVGDTVAAGETIGAVGTTGRSTGNHLHFEVHKNGVFVNPANYIGSN